MRAVLSSEAGHKLYKHRKATVEPVFGEEVQPRLRGSDAGPFRRRSEWRCWPLPTTS